MNTLKEQLIQASRKRDLSQVKSLIFQNAHYYALRSAARDGHLEIRWAARNGHLEVVKFLVEDCEADVNGGDHHALRYAALNGHLEVVKYLVEKCGADVRTKDDHALHWATYNRQLEVVKYLVKKCGAGVQALNEWALRRDAYNRQLEVVKYLKSYILSQFTKKHIDKQNLRYVFQQYELPFEIQQLISSYVLNKGRTDHLLII